MTVERRGARRGDQGVTERRGVHRRGLGLLSSAKCDVEKHDNMEGECGCGSMCGKWPGLSKREVLARCCRSKEEGRGSGLLQI